MPIKVMTFALYAIALTLALPYEYELMDVANADGVHAMLLQSLWP